MPKPETKPVRVQADLLQLVRTRILDQLEPRLERKRVGEDYRFSDANFVHFYGPGLERLSDTEIIMHALMLLDGHLREQPKGKVGIPLIDDITPGDHDLGAG